MLRAFELAIQQLSDPRLRSVIWQSLLLSLVLQLAIAGVAWWALQSFMHFSWHWLNEVALWAGRGTVIVLAFLLFPASFGVVISVFLERIADIVESTHYPELGRARGISVWTGLWTGLVFLVAVILLNLLMLPFYILALFVAGLGAVIFYALNGWLAARMYYEQVALRRMNPRDVATWRRANRLLLWGTGIVIVFLGTIPVVNLIVPVVGTAAMVHVAHMMRPPSAPGRPFNSPAGQR